MKKEAAATPKIGQIFCDIVSKNILPGISHGTPLRKKYLLNSLITNIEEIKRTLKKLLFILVKLKADFSINRGEVNINVNITINRIYIIEDIAIVVSP